MSAQPEHPEPDEAPAHGSPARKRLLGPSAEDPVLDAPPSGLRLVTWTALILSLLALVIVFVWSGDRSRETVGPDEVAALRARISTLEDARADHEKARAALEKRLSETVAAFQTDIRNLRDALRLTDNDLRELRKTLREQAAGPAPDTSSRGTPAASPLPEATPEPALAATRTYTIEPGDSFWTIAQRFDLSLETLEAANPGLDPRRLRPGMRIRLPATTADGR